MQVTINKLHYELPEGATLADAVAILEPRPPFAAAVNMEFVPKNLYPNTLLQADDRIEIILPVTGG